MSSSFSKENLELLDIAKLIATSTMAIAEAFEESDQSAHAAFQAIRTELDHVREQLKLLVDSPESNAESLWVNGRWLIFLFSFFLLLLPPVLNTPPPLHSHLPGIQASWVAVVPLELPVCVVQQ